MSEKQKEVGIFYVRKKKPFSPKAVFRSINLQNFPETCSSTYAVHLDLKMPAVYPSIWPYMYFRMYKRDFLQRMYVQGVREGSANDLK